MPASLGSCTVERGEDTHEVSDNGPPVTKASSYHIIELLVSECCSNVWVDMLVTCVDLVAMVLQARLLDAYNKWVNLTQEEVD